MLRDPLASWWRHPVTVRRWLGPGEAGGDVYAPDETVTGYYSDKTRYNGTEITASGRFGFPIGVDYIPVQSEVDLPAAFGGRTVRVVEVAVGDGGGQPTPDHQVAWLL